MCYRAELMSDSLGPVLSWPLYFQAGSSLSFTALFYFKMMCICVCVHMHVSAGAHERQEVSNPLELEW